MYMHHLTSGCILSTLCYVLFWFDVSGIFEDTFTLTLGRLQTKQFCFLDEDFLVVEENFREARNVRSDKTL